MEKQNICPELFADPIFLFSCQTQSHFKKKSLILKSRENCVAAVGENSAGKSYRKCSFKKKPTHFPYTTLVG